jgi:hypothetical protein
VVNKIKLTVVRETPGKGFFSPNFKVRNESRCIAQDRQDQRQTLRLSRLARNGTNESKKRFFKNASIYLNFLTGRHGLFR